MWTPAAAMRMLIVGNRRWAALKQDRPNQSRQRRKESATGQHPFATIFGCVDSRVPPELVFDRGIGDLFVVRSAAHVLDRAALASITFGAEDLEIPLVVVLGHDDCAAIGAVLEALDHDGRAPAHIEYLVEAIRPAVENARGGAGGRLGSTVRENARLVSARLNATPSLAARIRVGKLKVLPARYELRTGRVQFL
jgi:carbonic anhydrase